MSFSGDVSFMRRRLCLHFLPSQVHSGTMILPLITKKEKEREKKGGHINNAVSLYCFSTVMHGIGWLSGKRLKELALAKYVFSDISNAKQKKSGLRFKTPRWFCIDWRETNFWMTISRIKWFLNRSKINRPFQGKVLNVQFLFCCLPSQIKTYLRGLVPLQQRCIHFCR